MKEITPTTIATYLSTISPKPPSNKYVCIVNENGDNVCYNNRYPNQILCDSERCLINYKTLDQSYLGKKMPVGVKVTLYNNGPITAIQFIGTFRKSELPKVTAQIPDIQVKEVDVIGDPYYGIPRIPLKCRFPFGNSKECKKFKI